LHEQALHDVTRYLDGYLDLASFQDASQNGLQVENSGRVRRVGLAVDASLQAIVMAAGHGCDLLLVHHGLFWGLPIPVRGIHYRRLRALLQSDLALYAAHLPLDAHPEVGNNAQIASRLHLSREEPFARHGGRFLGVQGTLPAPLAWEDALETCRELFGRETQVLRFGPDRISRVGVVSGSATDPALFQEAAESRIDLLVTGEPKQAAYYLAQGMGLKVFYGGHYRTETFGVQALGERITARLGLPTVFLDTACPL